ncbi:MAG TPA: FHA domain-containing protein [Candidatus Bathyarchaeia archaeon]|nr:FHA domain-containing protein [Candidatus Bathyarchaeia archaeon]
MDLAQFQSMLTEAVASFKTKYPSFDEAYSSYSAQYGDSSIKVYEPYKISGTIDPVIIIIGRTTPLFYKDSRQTLTGSLGSFAIEKKNVYLLGRRKPHDSKLVVWSSTEEREIEHYDSRVRIIPSRIHAAIFSLGAEEVYFADLGSSSGSILAGESSKPEPFILLYATSSIDVRKVTMSAKYARVRG